LLEVYPAPLKRVRNALGESLKNFITGGIGLSMILSPARVESISGLVGDTRGYRARWLAVVIPLVLVVFALTLTVPRLTTPSVYVFDELYYAYTAGKYVTGDEAYSTAIPPREDPAIEWTHPPLAKLLIAGGILVAGDNFGCGSSREHAPWALLDFGIRCVISTSFADIFYNNCFKNGVLPIKMPKEIIDKLMDDASRGSNAIIEIDLEKQEIKGPDGGTVHFDIDPFRKHCLLNGLDDIGLTLRHVDQIDEFERTRAAYKPKTLPAKVDSGR
jgi:3-isopropylmalate dehydratase small subunit